MQEITYIYEAAPPVWWQLIPIAVVLVGAVAALTVAIVLIRASKSKRKIATPPPLPPAS